MKIDRSKEKEMIENRKVEVKELLKRGPVTFRHFKGNYYELLYIAKHTEEGYELAIYANPDIPDKIWARPLDMFLSYIEEKDVESYPEVEFRMTLMSK